MSALEKHLITKHQPSVSMHVLRRPVELTGFYGLCQILSNLDCRTISSSLRIYKLPHGDGSSSRCFLLICRSVHWVKHKNNQQELWTVFLLLALLGMRYSVH